MDRAKQMSESLELGVVLAAGGGFMDAYSYMERGHVFANAQTGNILLFGVHMSQGEWKQAMHYFVPVLFFALGIVIADLIRHHLRGLEKLHWRQGAILLEILALLVVSQIPHRLNLIANGITSLACGIQVESFRKLHGSGFATTMCIGNLRAMMNNLTLFFVRREKKYFRKGLMYLCIILSFTAGAVLGNICVEGMHAYAILVNAGILLIAGVMMFVDREIEESAVISSALKAHDEILRDALEKEERGDYTN